MRQILPIIISFPFHRVDIRSWIVPEFIGLDTVDIKTPYTYRLHQHNEYEVIIIDRGCYQCRLNNTPLQLTSGNLLIVKPGDRHEDACLPPLRYFAFSFRLQQKKPGEAPIALFHENITSDQQLIRVNRRRMWPILDAIRQETGMTDGMSSQIQDALLLEFFWRMIRALPSDRLSADFNQNTSDQHFVSQLSDLFRRHLNDKSAFQDMARLMGMSKSSFSHKCKRILGLSPMKAYMKTKMDYALKYLVHTPTTIKEISAYLGFETPYHFSKTFKHYEGHPPSYFRGQPPGSI